MKQDIWGCDIAFFEIVKAVFWLDNQTLTDSSVTDKQTDHFIATVMKIDDSCSPTCCQLRHSWSNRWKRVGTYKGDQNSDQFWEREKFSYIIFKVNQQCSLSFVSKFHDGKGWDEQTDFQRPVGLSVGRFREGWCIFAAMLALGNLLLLQSLFLCSEKSSCLPPWCAERRLSARWWTVGPCTTGSPLCSVSASRFHYSPLQLTALCKTEATLPLIVTFLPGAGRACRTFWRSLSVCWASRNSDLFT